MVVINQLLMTIIRFITESKVPKMYPLSVTSDTEASETSRPIGITVSVQEL